jgi:hypothetical protein
LTTATLTFTVNFTRYNCSKLKPPKILYNNPPARTYRTLNTNPQQSSR